MDKPNIILAEYPHVSEFDYYSAILNTLKKERKAVNEYKNGKKGVFNYLYGGVDKIPWGDCTIVFSSGKELQITIGHKIHQEDIKRLIEYMIENEEL